MDKFIQASRRLGENKIYVQGAGGNCSIKEDGILFVKASGYLMKDIALQKGIVQLPYKKLITYFSKKHIYTKENEKHFLQLIDNSLISQKDCKPSMETGFHAVIPSKYIFHLHSVYANIFTCMKDGDKQLQKLFPNESFIFLPYINPGYELALRLYKTNNIPQIIFLQNHGMIIHANSLTSCLKKIEKVHQTIEEYLKKKNVFIRFQINTSINRFNKYIFPDSAVFSKVSEKKLIPPKKHELLEIMSAQLYIIQIINLMQGKPKYLSKKDVSRLLSMQQEKHRQKLFLKEKKKDSKKTLFIIHRVNAIKDLQKISPKYGVEIDIRESNGDLILNHEAFKTGEKFEEYLKAFHHAFIIFNIKEAGIEEKVIELAEKFKIKNYFLLDVEAPYLYKASRQGVNKMAVRYSEVEPIELLKNYEGFVDWVWIDTVTSLPINSRIITKLKNFKTCLVSPDRWGRSEDIAIYKNKMKEIGFEPTAVMTSLTNVAEWEKLI